MVRKFESLRRRPKAVFLLLCALIPGGMAMGGRALAQPAVNPTVLSPPARQALPHGSVTADQPGKAQGGEPAVRHVRPHRHQNWHHAVPYHRGHHHQPPFVDERH